MPVTVIVLEIGDIILKAGTNIEVYTLKGLVHLRSLHAYALPGRASEERTRLTGID